MDIVLDTNVFVGALMRGDGVNRAVLKACFSGQCRPLLGEALYQEYEDLMARDYLFANSSFGARERQALFDDFCAICRWVSVHYRWRPNLRDEGDNHIVELALAGGAERVVTWNSRDFTAGALVFHELVILDPAEFLQDLREGSM